MKRLLFICTGNTCRSSMAEGLAKMIFKESGLSEWQIHSAGTFAVKDQQANSKAIKVAKDKNIDLSQHKSKSVPINIEDYDLILTMTKSHKNQIETLYNIDKGNIFTLNEYAHGTEEDIIDPFGREIAVYRETFKELEVAVEKVANKLKKQ